MRLSLQRGTAMLAVLAALGGGVLPQTARADIDSGRSAIQAGDYPKAIEELQPLADKGDATAEYLLAEIYYGGHGGSLPEAVKWMTAAAEQGYAQAQARLGLMYATGKGVPLDNMTAYRWFALAAQLATADSQKNLKTVSETNRDVVARRLTPDERKRADADIAAWKPGSSMPPRDAQPATAPAALPATIGTIGQVIPGIRIQLAAVRKDSEAAPEWARLQHVLGDAVSGLSLTVESVDLGTKGIYHRIQAGPFPDKASAAAKCEAIQALKQACIVVVRK
jgi:TPR repeat protein